MNAVSPAAIAIRLADEGVPLRAIARATNIPSTRLYETLTIAKLSGQLLDLPRDDWPPGCPRDQRALQLSRLVTENHDTLMLAIQQVFGLTMQPARLMLLLMQHEQVPHARLDIDHNVLTVHVWAMRKALAQHQIKIKTLWGYGYQISAEHRKKAMELILSRLSANKLQLKRAAGF